MDIGDIMAAVGIFLLFLWCLSFYFNTSLPRSFSLSHLIWKQQFLKELLTITLFCSCFVLIAFIWFLLSSHSDKSSFVEMSSPTVSIQIPLEDRLSPIWTIHWLFLFKWFLSFHTLDNNLVTYGIFHTTQHILKMCISDERHWSGQQLSGFV